MDNLKSAMTGVREVGIAEQVLDQGDTQRVVGDVGNTLGRHRKRLGRQVAQTVDGRGVEPSTPTPMDLRPRRVFLARVDLARPSNVSPQNVRVETPSPFMQQQADQHADIGGRWVGAHEVPRRALVQVVEWRQRMKCSQSPQSGCWIVRKALRKRERGMWHEPLATLLDERGEAVHDARRELPSAVSPTEKPTKYGLVWQTAGLHRSLETGEGIDSRFFGRGAEPSRQRAACRCC